MSLLEQERKVSHNQQDPLFSVDPFQFGPDAFEFKLVPSVIKNIGV
jgi:hypothetical protein